MSDDDPSLENPQPDDPLTLAREVADRFRRAGDKADATKPRPRRPKKKHPRQPGREDAVPLSSVLDELVDQQGWSDHLSNQRVFTHWGLIVGSEVAQHSEVLSFEDGEVVVSADSTAWATQLRLLAPRIVAKLNDELGDGSVLRILVRGPQAPSWKKGKRTIRGARGPRDTYG